MNNKKWVSIIPHCRYIGWSREEKGIHKARPEIGI